ncbi:hypothetical protein LMTR3_22115 [Bradyrhizobium sp. LMTR 3]|nr:hypothetical protein LMTR3_22115 [Bradyrhizobium sp. LMTR 3]
MKALYRKHLSLDELFETLDGFPKMPPQAEALIGSFSFRGHAKGKHLAHNRRFLRLNAVAGDRKDP